MKKLDSITILCLLALCLLSSQADAVSVSRTLNVTVIGGGSACSATGTNGATIQVSNCAPTAGDTVTVTVNPGSNTTTSADVVRWEWAPPRVPALLGVNGDFLSFPYDINPFISVPTGTTVVTWKVPKEPHEDPMAYVLDYRIGSSGVNAAIAVRSPSIIVPPTIPPLPALTATPPAAVTANPPGWPASPARVITVCASGCDFTTIGAGIASANAVGTDFTQIKVASGTYPECLEAFQEGVGNDIHGPPNHLWIKGILGVGGTTMPHLTNTCPLTGAFWLGGPIALNLTQFTLDNMEISGGAAGNVGAITCNGLGNYIFRNIYLHDTNMGLHCGQGTNTYDITVLNSHFARCGGPDGPAHCLYVDGGALTHDNHLDIENSVFEMSKFGHLIKTRFMINTIKCNTLIQAYNEVDNGSLLIDLATYGGQSTITNNLMVRGPYFIDGTQNNQIEMEWAIENTAFAVDPHNDTFVPRFLQLDGNIWINDLLFGTIPNIKLEGLEGQMVTLGTPMSGTLPRVWTNNTFIGPYGNWPNDLGADNPGPAVCYNNTNLNCGTVTDNVTLDGTNTHYADRTAAAAAHPGTYGAFTPGTIVTWPLNPAIFPPMPTACTAPVGNVAVPAN